MERRGLWQHDRRAAEREQNEAEREPAVAEMENPEQWLAPGRKTAPARETGAVCQPRGECRPRSREMCRFENPQGEGHRRHGEDGAVEAAEDPWRGDFRALSGEPVSCKARDDASTNNADQHQQSGNAEPVAEFRGCGDADCCEMDE